MEKRTPAPRQSHLLPSAIASTVFISEAGRCAGTTVEAAARTGGAEVVVVGGADVVVGGAVVVDASAGTVLVVVGASAGTALPRAGCTPARPRAPTAMASPPKAIRRPPPRPSRLSVRTTPRFT